MNKSNKELSTDPYKGVRDFYPEDMAVQQYMFDVWSKTAESFGFERYDASILEPSALYRSKGAVNEEMVNEQTYTFTDRGDREVTLRPEMTPSVARMIAGKHRELSFPVRWYSIPNLFRYERMQRGRLREHWQLNCDIFGAEHMSADVELIALAHQIFINFGADSDMFEVRINSRKALDAHFETSGITDSETIAAVTNIIDKKAKMSEEEFATKLTEAAGGEFALPDSTPKEVSDVLDALSELGITNAVHDPSIVRGFDYYTGTVFEIFDKNPENNRSMMGGGRYDNLTEMFLPAGQAGGGEPITGVGFGFGDVTLRNFLESNDLLTSNITSPSLMVIPTDTEFNLEGQKIAKAFRDAGMSVSVDISNRKVGKKISAASDALAEYVLVLGEDEIKSQNYTLKNLIEETEESGTLDTLIAQLTN
ncbi:MAG: histidyl-tRNA synthetase [Candidatus Azotimanducaceae bacterium]|jgi:histidyl-tRNA synthetase